MWTFSQTTGVITHNEIAIGRGYSGRGEGVRNPAMQNVPMVGPCPQGIYTIGNAATDPHLGPVAMRLQPAANNQMFGRSGFFIHGDNANLNHTASEGCIILERNIRTGIAAAVLQGDNTLHVTE